MDTRSSRPAAPSLAALLGGIMCDAKDLLVQELTLAKLEGHDELDKIKTAVLFLWRPVDHAVYHPARG